MINQLLEYINNSSEKTFKVEELLKKFSSKFLSEILDGKIEGNMLFLNSPNSGPIYITIDKERIKNQMFIYSKKFLISAEGDLLVEALSACKKSLEYLHLQKDVAQVYSGIYSLDNSDSKEVVEKMILQVEARRQEIRAKLLDKSGVYKVKGIFK